MRLFDLIDDKDGAVAQSGALKDVEVTGLTADSRQVEPGYLFAALPGSHHDGRQYIAEALRRGAGSILAPRGTALPDGFAGIPIVEDDQPARRLALIAARFYPAQPEIIAAVTGTNGKTSVANFLRQLWAHGNLAAASLGTLGVTGPGFHEPGTLTTPDPVKLHQILSLLTDAGVSHLAMEASSHGIEQFRLDGVRLQAAAFTNLSRDHLDYHRTEDAYFAAKSRLFSALLPDGGMAVLNADIPQFPALVAIARARGQHIIAFGKEGSDIRVVQSRPDGLGQRVTFEIAGHTRDVLLPLVGGFQISNAACAIGLFIATGGDAEAALDGAADLQGAAGRMELIGRRPNGAAVFVDYAHTPDALANALAALRPHTEGRLAVVFGCGGDRDKGKRPEMGRIAAEAADAAIVTDDNPRGEDAAAIRREILQGAPGGTGLTEIADRRTAIAK
ncbi:MAG: UDP-N-acetylmuramoyl-L-alanyl-D-glutamate--2,6-diaminopimelate ligase, partial [Alphaproteobacteria bacterium]|nr:UDP-N-acetylmuramoyl-L-alanyl-D-glutamate--2,6-diaminopimelate ligase [Alphaproteobacteria bacterium]